jgi:hypothetical protein
VLEVAQLYTGQNPSTIFQLLKFNGQPVRKSVMVWWNRGEWRRPQESKYAPVGVSQRNLKLFRSQLASMLMEKENITQLQYDSMIPYYHTVFFGFLLGCFLRIKIVLVLYNDQTFYI